MVLPPATPVTTPEELMVAIEVLLLIQPPPETESVKVVVAPLQTVEEPEMADTVGRGFTVTDLVAI